MLEGKTIWITRPEGQGETLTAALEQAGALVRNLPMLAIEPLPEDAIIKARVLDLDRYDLLFFISTNAASLGMVLIDKYWPQFPLSLDIYAVGPATAAVIERYGMQVHYPESRMSSEALLALPSLKNISGKKALIVRGSGGRELLASELTDRGASVDYLELYRRVCPDYAKGSISDLFNTDKPSAVVVTSAEALDNLQDLLAADRVEASAVVLYVSSQRISDLAIQEGFRRTITMPGADDKAIIDSLQENS